MSTQLNATDNGLTRDPVLDNSGGKQSTSTISMTDDMGCEVKAFTPPSFDPETEGVEMKKYLIEHGYVVVSNVFKGEAPSASAAIEETKGLMWDYMENTLPKSKLKRNDPETWDDPSQWPADEESGIISGFGFGHCDFMWKVRNLKRVKKTFENIWDTDELLVSFDGGNAFRPWQYENEWVTKSGWWHVDQNSSKSHKVGDNTSGMSCVQGLVTLTVADETTGGLCVIPGSHKDHTALCKRFKYHMATGDYVSVKSGDVILKNGGVLLEAKPGDLLLWDSRTVHCNTRALTYDSYVKNERQQQKLADNSGENSDVAESCNATDDENMDDNSDRAKNGEKTPPVTLLRQVAYVCMTPSQWADRETLAKRRTAFIENTSTSHWPHEFYGGGVRGIDLPGGKPNDPNEISGEQRKLIGLPENPETNCTIS